MNENQLIVDIELAYLNDLAEAKVKKLDLDSYYKLYRFVESLKNKITYLPDEEKEIAENLNQIKLIISFSMQLRDELNLRLQRHREMKKERESTGVTKKKTPYKVKHHVRS